MTNKTAQVCILLICFSKIFFVSAMSTSTAGQIGGCYGGELSQRPSSEEILALLQGYNFGKVRFFADVDTTPGVADYLAALKNTSIEIIVGIVNEDLGEGITNATVWLQNNVLKYYPDANIKYIGVGQEFLTDSTNITTLLQALTSFQDAVNAAGLQHKLKVTKLSTKKVSTTHSAHDILTRWDQPSKASFTEEKRDAMKKILKFLSDNKSPFMANIHPFYAFRKNPSVTSLDCALFKPCTPMKDSGNGLVYHNLLDAIHDSLVAAMEKLGFPDIPIIVTETGWPSDAGDHASVDNAATYINNLIKHVSSGSGTPARRGIYIPTYIYTLYDEDGKGGSGFWLHFGVFYMEGIPKYYVNFWPMGFTWCEFGDTVSTFP